MGDDHYWGVWHHKEPYTAYRKLRPRIAVPLDPGPKLRRLERLPEGWGIVCDDLGAGLYALGVATLLRIWI